jgi:hypothetical protein
MVTPPQQNMNVAPQQNDAVMDQVRRERGAAPDMEVIEILERTAGARGADPVAVNNTLAKLVNTNPDFRVIRANNTLFVYINNRDGSINVSMETADSPRALVDSIGEFCRAMKAVGFKTIKFPVGNPQILRAITMAGFYPTTQASGGFMEDGNTPQMIATVEV